MSSVAVSQGSGHRSGDSLVLVDFSACRVECGTLPQSVKRKNGPDVGVCRHAFIQKYSLRARSGQALFWSRRTAWWSNAQGPCPPGAQTSDNRQVNEQEKQEAELCSVLRLKGPFCSRAWWGLSWIGFCGHCFCLSFNNNLFPKPGLY